MAADKGGERKVHTRLADAAAYVTKDGSVVRELMHPHVHGNANTSLAEAVVAAGKTTHLHKHHRSEEIYHITAGSGLMELGGGQFMVHAGDTVCIDPGTVHCITNTSSTSELRLLAISAPPYTHSDTELTSRDSEKLKI